MLLSTVVVAASWASFKSAAANVFASAKSWSAVVCAVPAVVVAVVAVFSKAVTAATVVAASIAAWASLIAVCCVVAVANCDLASSNKAAILVFSGLSVAICVKAEISLLICAMFSVTCAN